MMVRLTGTFTRLDGTPASGMVREYPAHAAARYLATTL